MIKQVLKIVIVIFAAINTCCDTTQPDPAGSENSFIVLVMNTERVVILDEPLTVSCYFHITYPVDTFLTSGTWVAEGQFIVPQYGWEFVSGDSIWIDTLRACEPAIHSIVIKPVERGNYFIRSRVFAPFDKLSGNSGLEERGLLIMEVR